MRRCLAAALSGPVLMTAYAYCDEAVSDDCTFENLDLRGKVQIVESFPDLKVQTVSSFADLKVKPVTSFPGDCGEWQFVDSFPDFKIQFVESFPDIKIEIVESFPGVP